MQQAGADMPCTTCTPDKRIASFCTSERASPVPAARQSSRKNIVVCWCCQCSRPTQTCCAQPAHLTSALPVPAARQQKDCWCAAGRNDTFVLNEHTGTACAKQLVLNEHTGKTDTFVLN
eukprot:scaffold48440_cov17-Tisochrysis_lutea.AAC.1